MAGIEGRSIEDVMATHEMQEQAIWALWEAKRLMFSFVNDDREDRTRTLREYLERLKAGGSAQLFQVRWYEDGVKKINDKTEYIGSYNFKLNEATWVTPSQPAATPSMDLINQLFAAKLDALSVRYETQIEKLQDDLAQAQAMQLQDDEDDDDALGALGMIGKAGVQYPWLQDILKSGLQLLEKLTGKLNLNMAKGTGAAAQIAGMPDSTVSPNERLNWAVSTLIEVYANQNGGREKGDPALAQDMCSLANMAVTNPQSFKMAINMLRSM